MTAKFTPADVVARYKALGEKVATATDGVFPRDGIWAKGQPNSCHCAMGIMLLGEPVTDVILNDPEEPRSINKAKSISAQLGIDYVTFYRGFDTPHYTAHSDYTPDEQASWELGKACWAACVEAGLV